MFKKTALVAGIGLALSVTAQADYQWELGAGYTYGNYDTDIKHNSNGLSVDDPDEDIYGVSGTWYMENVDTSKGPLNEAAFLDHASSINVFATDGNVNFDSKDLSDEDGQTYGIDMRYVAEGPGWKLSGWLMDLGYEYQEPGDRNVDIYHVGIGKYLTPNTTLVVDYQSLNVSNGGDTDGYSVDLSHFFAFSHGGLKVDAGAGKVVISNADDVDVYTLDGTWYLTNNLGFGAGYQNTSQDGYEVNSWNVNANWFITESFAMDLSYGQDDFDDIDLPQAIGGGKLELQKDVASVGAKFRF